MRRSQRSRDSGSSAPPDPYPLALVLLGRQELSEVQLRARLARRGCDAGTIEPAIARLKSERLLDDSRVAGAAARLEATIRRRGPARVRQRLRAMGIDADTVQLAVEETFATVDAAVLLDEALARRLKGRELAELDPKARARLARSLIGQGFSVSEVLKRLRS